jgi:hypothetical protein
MNEGMKNSSNAMGVFDPIQDLEHDHLGRHRFANRLLRRISAPDCSAAIGLYGGWGVGKTSILKLMETLNNKEKSPVFEKPQLKYIDVWPYEVSGDLALPILVQTRELVGSLPEGYSRSWRRILGVLAQAGIDITLRKLLNLQLSNVKDYLGNLRDVSPDFLNIRDFETLVDDIQGAQNAFGELVQLAIKSHRQPGSMLT